MAIARELKRRFPGLEIAVVEKEREPGRHASSRNSGVIHAGFYYSPDSLKARLTARGNRLLKRFCAERGVPVRESGKVVVAKHEQELPTLRLLYERGQKNGVELKLLSEKELKELEPNARTSGYALFSPHTATVDPRAVCQALYQELLELGVHFYLSTTFPDFPHPYRYLVNAAGLQALKVARLFKVGEEYAVVPFKGLFFRYTGAYPPVTRAVYPVPHLKNPFLGVHFTVRSDGSIYLGPTALPVLSLENYQGLQGFRLGEFFPLLWNHLNLWLRSEEYREIAWEELGNLRKKKVIENAGKLVYDMDREDRWFQKEPAGIRAQLVDRRSFRMVLDFLVLPGKNSLHILNAVSPAFTSAFSFAEYVVDLIMKDLGVSHALRSS
ncbi:MAG: FAD-dependent oxidoreductase [Candidatus Methanomethylicaceae archaeon]